MAGPHATQASLIDRRISEIENESKRLRDGRAIAYAQLQSDLAGIPSDSQGAIESRLLRYRRYESNHNAVIQGLEREKNSLFAQKEHYSSEAQAERQEMIAGNPKKGQVTNQAAVLIMAGLEVLGALAALFFVPGSPAQLYGKKSASKSHSGDERETEYAFAVSSAYFQNICDWQGDFGPDAEWAGNAGARYALSNIGSAYMAGRIAAINNNVNTTVQTERAQVNDGQQTLGNCFDGLQLAMPVSEALYFSGPAGPNLSYIFQLAVTNPAVSTGIDTTNTMHENSHNHGHRFTALAQQYEAILALLP